MAKVQPNFTALEIDFKPIPLAIKSPLELVTGTYYDTGRWGQPPTIGGPINERRGVAFVGVDGTSQVDYGFRSRNIYVTLLWASGADGGVSAATAAMVADCDALYQNARYDIVYGSTTLKGCKVASWNAPFWITMSNGVILGMPTIFHQLDRDV